MDYPSNSHKSREAAQPAPREEKKVEKVVENEVVRRKKPLGKKFAETFFGGSAEDAWSYVMFDVLVPAAKDTIADAVSTTVERVLFGESRSATRRNGGYSQKGPTDYRSKFSSGSSRYGYSRQEDPRPQLSRQARSTHDFDEIVLATRVEAEEVIDRLFSIVSQYETATVSDLYDMLGITGSYTDDKWGWTDIRGAGVTRLRNGGYLLDLPKPEPLN